MAFSKACTLDQIYKRFHFRPQNCCSCVTNRTKGDHFIKKNKKNHCVNSHNNAILTLHNCDLEISIHFKLTASALWFPLMSLKKRVLSGVAQSFHTVTFHISTLSLSFKFPHEALKKLRHFYGAIKYWSKRSDKSGFAYSIFGFERQMFKRPGRRLRQNPAWRMQVARYSWMFCCYTSDLQIFWKWQVGESVLSVVSLFSFCLDDRLKAALYKNLFSPLPLFTSHSSHDQTQML